MQYGGDRGAGGAAGDADPGAGQSAGAAGYGHVPLQRGSGGDVGGDRPARFSIRLEQLLLRNCTGILICDLFSLPTS